MRFPPVALQDGRFARCDPAWSSSRAGGWLFHIAPCHPIYYWPNRRYSLLEMYRSDGTLDEIYVDITSPVEIVDEGEFREAMSRYGYSEEFQQACYEAAREGVDVANGWVAGGMPTVDPGRAGA